MTPEEKKAAVKTAQIIRSARKQRGWTQIDTAKKIGISQSALSKMESGSLIPSVHQWFEFCSSAGIPADSHIQGYLDRMEPIRFQDKVISDFKVHDIYRRDAGSTARSMAPMVQSLFANIGEAKAYKMIKEMGVDPDYFVDLGNQINFRFFVDLFQATKKKGIYKKSDLNEMTHQASSRKSHGGLFSSYQQVSDVETLMKTAFAKSSFYEVNFDYRLEEINPKKISFSVSPREHLLVNKNLQYSEAREFIHDYRGGYFKNLAGSLNAKQVSVKSVTCVSNEADRSVYDMALS